MRELIDVIQSEVGESFQQNGSSLMQRIIVSSYQLDINLWLRTIKSMTSRRLHFTSVTSSGPQTASAYK